MTTPITSPYAPHVCPQCGIEHHPFLGNPESAPHRMLDKVDVVEAIAEALDNKYIDGLGFVLANHGDEYGEMIMQVWANGDDMPSTDFRSIITRMRT